MPEETKELTLVEIAASRGKGTPHEEAVAKIAKLLSTAEESKTGGRRGKMIRNQTVEQCHRALRQFVYGGTSAAGAATTAGLDLDKVVV